MKTRIDSHYMINDGLHEMAANGVQFVADKNTGIAYAVYLSSDNAIGESDQLIKIAKFNIMQPTNIEWITVFDSEVDFSGKCLSECYIVDLNNTVVRVFALDMGKNTYYYKDVEKKSLSVGAINEVKVKFDENAEAVSLNLENVNALLTLNGISTVPYCNMSSSFVKVDESYYGIICGENIESPLFVKSSDGGAVWTFQSVIPHRVNYEATLCYHNSRFWVIFRDGFTKETEETSQPLMYSDDGIIWTQSNLFLTVSDTRPWLFNYQGDLYLAYSSPMPESFSTVRTWRCNIHIGKIVSVNGEETFEEIVYKESKFGIVYYALIDWYGYMIMLYSSGELHPTEGLMGGWSQGKDCLNYTVIHSQEPKLSF